MNAQHNSPADRADVAAIPLQLPVVLKVWQCHSHQNNLRLLGVTVKQNPMAAQLRGTSEEDCPYCVIDRQQAELNHLRSKLEQQHGGTFVPSEYD